MLWPCLACHACGNHVADAGTWQTLQCHCKRSDCLLDKFASWPQAIPAPGSNPVREYLDNNRAARVGLYAGVVLLAGTLVLAAFRVFRKYNTPQNKRKRNVSKNKVTYTYNDVCLPLLFSRAVSSQVHSLHMYMPYLMLRPGGFLLLQLIVETLAEYLPTNRASLTPSKC